MPASTTSSGKEIITAPSVPPNTIKAAVGCRIWRTLPPSSNKPPARAPMAKIKPVTLLLSIGSETDFSVDRQLPESAGPGPDLAPGTARDPRHSAPPATSMDPSPPEHDGETPQSHPRWSRPAPAPL